MSRVTNVMVYVSGLEPDDILRCINAFFEQNSDELSGQTGLVNINDPSLPRVWYGGKHKAFEARLFIGAYNFFGLPDFMDHLRTIPWEWPEVVQVIVQEQDDDGFRIIEL